MSVDAMADVDGCCALRIDHEGCCAYRCATCSGNGRCPSCDDSLDDVESCDWCDSTGACSECMGAGWFNEFGEACAAPTPDELALAIVGAHPKGTT